MSRPISFLGLGIGSGQKKSGLELSPIWALNFIQHVNKSNKVQIDLCQKAMILEGPEKIQTKFFDGGTQTIETDKLYEVAMHLAHHHLGDNHLNHLAVNWGGDHSVGYSTVSAFLQKHPHGKVIWIDAHGDINTPGSSPTGNLHGMPVALLMGLFSSNEFSKRPISNLKTKLNSEQFLYFGVRDLDPFESEFIESNKLKCWTSTQIHSTPQGQLIEQLKLWLGNDPLHISFDIDAMDSSYKISTGLSVDNGLSVSDLQIILSAIVSSAQVVSVDIVEINPMIGDLPDVLNTYQLAFDFISKILSKGEYNANFFRDSETKDSARVEQGRPI
jgi:arginase